jgi:very-short-patch-repair endonuclease
MTAKITLQPQDLNGLIESYNNGDSILQLSNRLNHSRPVIRRILRGAGIQLRNQSESESIKWSRLKYDPSSAARRLTKAWAARRGAKDRTETLVARAQTNYQRKLHVHRGEDAIGAAIQSKGLKVEYQYPVGIYSIDIAIPDLRIAVEVIGSNWKPRHAEKLNKRTGFLLKEGWLVLFTLIWRKDVGLYRPRNSDNTFAKPIRIQPYFDPRRVAHYIAGLVEQLDRGAKLHGKFNVIAGNGHSLRTPRVLSEHLPRIPRG